MKSYSIATSHLLILIGSVITSTALAQQGTSGDEWPTYGGDKGSTKYAPLDQITPDNFENLEIAWTWESIDAEVLALEGTRVRPQEFKSTPIMANGVLYTSTSFSQVAAIDAGTGEMIWKYDSGSWRAGRPANIGFIHRGVSYWTDGEIERVIVATGHSHLIALDAGTGIPDPKFGDNGHVNLFDGLNRPGRVGAHQVNSPPIIANDTIIVGSVIMDRPTTQQYIRGDIRAYDVRTGKQLWTFHSIPQAGEFGNDTWENDSWKYTGHTNVWSLMSADEELGYVYLPFGAATNDFYGGHRLGDNLYATSLVCLDIKTGKRIWHFQTVHHDLWDYDLPCAPNLLDTVVDGKPVKMVAQFSKTGYCYVFNRVTGEPIWPINETPVPQSTVPGEKTSPTQPIPTKPAPFAAQGITLDNVIDFTPEIKAEALEIIKEYGFAPMFTPPSEKGVLMTPGDGGGANWAGAALDPKTSTLYVPSISYTRILALAKPDPARSDMDYVVDLRPIAGPSGLPLFKPPYSKITAIDMSTGLHIWTQPIGRGVENHSRLKDLNIPPTGGGFWAFPVATETMLIAAQGSSVHAMDKATGEFVGEVKLNGSRGTPIGRVTGAPITYMHNGRQYIVVAVTSGSRAYLVGLTLS